jgi:type I restriction enzyme S subunit
LPFVYAITKLPDFRQKILDRSTGSAQPNVSADEIKKMKIVLPPDDILKKFIRFTSNYYAMMIHNANENDRLKKLQNALLPRLLSGEMDVLDAEKHVANML